LVKGYDGGHFVSICQMANTVECGQNACGISWIHIYHWQKVHRGLARVFTISAMKKIHHPLPIGSLPVKAEWKLPKNVYSWLDSISSRFYVLNTPISTTAPIDAKTHVWPIDGIAQWLTKFDWLPVTTKSRVNNYERIIDMHIILVRVIHSIQNQHFAEMFTYSDNTNYNLNFYYFIVSIYLWFHLFGNFSYVSDVSDGIFACWVQRRSQRPLSTKQP
jgi:hypothetical protein